MRSGSFGAHGMCRLLIGLLSAGPLPAGLGQPVGTVSVSGRDAWVNGTLLVSGRTLFSGDRVQTGHSTTAALQLSGGLVLAAVRTEVVVCESGVRLERGRIQTRPVAGGALDIEGGFFRVLFVGQGGVAALAEVEVDAAKARVTPLRGVAEVRVAGETYRVRAGEAAVLPLLQQSQSAGQVSRVIPEVRIYRGTEELPAAAQSPIEWNDELRSGPAGRARLSLSDGSMLNLGSASSLRVLQHDAAAKQTQLQLAYGRLRTRVARPGSKLEVRTPGGIASAAGADFFLFVTADFTQLIVFEGDLIFTSALTGQSVVAQPGQRASIQRYGALDGPVQATPEEIQQAKSSTDLPEEKEETPAAPATQATRPVAGAKSKTPIILVVVGAGAVAAIAVPLARRGSASPSSPSP